MTTEHIARITQQGYVDTIKAWWARKGFAVHMFLVPIYVEKEVLDTENQAHDTDGNPLTHPDGSPIYTTKTLPRIVGFAIESDMINGMPRSQYNRAREHRGEVGAVPWVPRAPKYDFVTGEQL